MLYADKNALRTNLKVNLLRIRERELNFYTNNCLSISTQAALLAGFAWYGLTEVPFTEQANDVVQTVYLVVTTCIMGLEMLTVVNATLCAILGPGLALRGPDGSMHKAVDGMMTHYRFTFACFSLGLLCFQFSALLYSWMQFSWSERARARAARWGSASDRGALRAPSLALASRRRVAAFLPRPFSANPPRCSNSSSCKSAIPLFARVRLAPPLAELSVPLTILLAFAVHVMYRSSVRIYRSLKLDADTIVTGEFDEVQ